MDNSTDMNSLQKEIEMLKVNLDSFYLVMMSIIIFLMQCGFAFLEAGAVRSKNVVNILSKNLLDCLLGALIYWAIGYGISHGSGNSPFIGFGQFFSYKMDHLKYAEWLFDFTFATTCATIVSGSIAERTKMAGYFIYTIFYVGTF